MFSRILLARTCELCDIRANANYCMQVTDTLSNGFRKVMAVNWGSHQAEIVMIALASLDLGPVFFCFLCWDNPWMTRYVEMLRWTKFTDQSIREAR